MTKLLTVEEMRLIDSIAINKIGIAGLCLMENAGKSVADFISERWGKIRDVYIFCGPGNNGGDGFVVARHLYNRGCKVEVFLVGPRQKVKGDARVNLDVICKMGISVKEILSSDELPEEGREKEKILIDAMLGTGAKGAPAGVIKDMILLFNRWQGIKVAVDIPSGVNATTGEVAGEAVKVDYTITFAYPKRGLYLTPGIDYAGKVKVVDIGIPRDIVEKEGMDIRVNLLSIEDFSPAIFSRLPSSHKGNFGHLFIIAGSPGLTGAAALAGMGALRVGTGLVTVGIPLSLNPVLEVKLTEVMSYPLPETDEGTLSLKALDKIVEFSQRCEAVVFGPGLSRNLETVKLAREVLKALELPLVLDADGLNAFSQNTRLLSEYRGPLVLTPHPGELARLLGTSSSEIQKNRIKSACSFAREVGKVVVLKGAGTVIADPQGNCWLNTTGNPGMASGGTGDVLSGMIGGFLAQGMDPLLAAKLGVYLHGLAADIALEKQGGIPLLIAQDIIENLVSAIRSLKNGYN